MRTIMYVLGSALFGLAYSVFVVRFYDAVASKLPRRAAFWDLVIGVLAIAPFQVWAVSGSNAWVLVGEVVGSAVGTYIAVRWS
jgi:hypothetical protein